MSAPDLIDFQQALIDALPTAVAVFDRDQRLRGSNGRFAELWQLSPAWLDDAPTLNDVLEQLRQDRRLPEQSDFQSYRRRWTAKFGTDNPPPEDLFLPDGRVLSASFGPISGGGMVVAFEDKTDRLSAERTQNEAVAVQRAALDHLNDGIAVIGSDGCLDFCNTAFNEMWNLDPSHRVDRPHLRTLLASFEQIAADVQADNLVGRLISRMEGHDAWPLDDGRTIATSHVPLPDGATLLHFVDITTASDNTAALEARAIDLAAVAQLKTTFLAHLSNELRTPLNTISGFAQLLAGSYFGALNKRQQEYSDGIVTTAEKMASLLTDIVDLATIEAGLLNIDRDAVDLHALLVSILTLVEGQARNRKITMAFDCAPDIGWIEGDARRLKQALLHLLNNALTFTSGGGGVTLTARADAGDVVIEVIDTGVGIPKADQARIRDAFQTGEVDRGDSEGAGLGLTIVERLIGLHGGNIDIISRAGRGTTVSCRLPRGTNNEK